MILKGNFCKETKRRQSKTLVLFIVFFFKSSRGRGDQEKQNMIQRRRQKAQQPEQLDEINQKEGKKRKFNNNRDLFAVRFRTIAA